MPGPSEPPIVGLNRPILWNELNRVLHKVKTHKAPGRDGIPAEFYKLARNDIDSNEPSCELGRTLLVLLNRIFDTGHIPDKWNEAWVVSIFKKGDPVVMGNYRGISLLVVLIKLLTIVVTSRLGGFLEERQWLAREQAGFRPTEECVGHICCLYEILIRRSIMRKRTFVAFIDIKKAYDTVPIEALLRKLHMLGVDGKAYRFYEALYENAAIRVRTKYGLSDSVKLMRGLRQGCNASPLLFDIFINDILDECKRFGVKIMGLDAKHREVGLIFADDIALMCGSVSKLRRALRCIQAWGDKFEMRYGVDKCGLMGFGEGAPERLQETRDMWILDGKPIPLVSEYVYLGVPFTETLDLKVMGDARAKKGEHCLNALRPVLSCSDIPLSVRVRLVKALLIPVLTYGSELWGMSDDRAQSTQRVLNEALRLLVGMKKQSTITSTATIGLEFEIDSMSAMASAARARAFLKFASLRTTIASLVVSPPRARKKTWVTGCQMWMKRFSPAALMANTSAKQVSSIVRSVCRDRQTKGSVTAKRFDEYGFQLTTGYLKIALRYPKATRGIRWLCKMRVNAFWTATHFQRIGWLGDQYLRKCPFCRVRDTEETLEHLLMECRRWNVTRTKYLSDFVEQGGDYINLLGGSREASGVSHADMLAWWQGPQAEAREADEALQIGDDVETHVGAPGCVRVANFLQEMMSERLRILAHILQAPRADADIGMAVLMVQAEAGDEPVEDVTVNTRRANGAPT